MPALLEVQRALRAQLFEAAPDADALFAGAEVAQCVAIYRHTCESTLVTALRLSYPAIERLVGVEFFDPAAAQFVRASRPASAYLNDYGAGFAAFLDGFAPAAAIVYLADVARLEWAVNRALHAPDSAPLALEALAGLPPTSWSSVRFAPHPALTLLRLDYPADQIWRAVIERDDAAMVAIELTRAPVYLLIERDANGVQVRRLDPEAWRFTDALCAGRPLWAAIEPGTPLAVEHLLAEHLSGGRFIDFELTNATDDGETQA